MGSGTAPADVGVARGSQIERYFPGGQALGNLLGKHFGIGGRGDGLGSENSAFLVMSVAAVNAGPAIDDDLRAEGANHADHVFERDATPDFLGLLGRLYVASVHSAREKLADAVVLVGGEEFFGADDAEFGALFGADGVLSALAAGDGEKGDIGIESAREVGE